MGEAAEKEEQIIDEIDDTGEEESHEAISSAFCHIAVTDNLDSEQQKILSLIAMSLAYADHAKVREDDIFIQRLKKVLSESVEVEQLCDMYLQERDNFPLFLEKFESALQQGTIIEALHFIRTGEESDTKKVDTEEGLDYHALQKNLSSEDILKDIISLFLRTSYKKHKSDTSSKDPVTPTLVLQELAPNVYKDYKAKELLRHQHVGSWINMLDRSKPKITQLKEKLSRGDSDLKHNYVPFTISHNEILNSLDKAIGFPKEMHENTIYVLLAIMGHTASSDGQIAEVEEAKFIGGFIHRMDLKIDQEIFREKMAIPINDLLETVKEPEIAFAVFYEMMGVVFSNLEIDDEEKKLLDSVQKRFKISDEMVNLMYSRLYLDASLKGVESSLIESSNMFGDQNTNFHEFHKLFECFESVDVKNLIQTSRKFLAEFDPIDIPTIAPKKVKVAIVSLVGNALGLDGVLDSEEKKLLASLMQKLEITGQDLKTYPELMKGCSINQLCRALDKWFISKNLQKHLPAVAFYVLQAIGSDGVIDEKEEVFKNSLFKELGLHSSQYARMMLRVFWDYHLGSKEP
ncbi:TerB family tellurite resistance protein [Pseudobacteriovorax antillogorgiicola]|uniref:Tellurite resistance protein TerB n=1 Tax=Pseudobacteriovorax antillogorgiicola TaxID=1513793 RepID=A0A1Y6BAL0_9BACT|nr:TerB family tellurite resistance protein [Pseudobacteriovorax antillogorgiicola]TCS58906.1 hypothetical protein EDD56_102421 [Pseudobacteriovorax antillogorgiicola]SME93310.1 hypothetical protein SAMN06296036_10222 [Pseudobacteriovorax antillogorgiicola]